MEEEPLIRRAGLTDLPALDRLDMTVFSPDSLAVEFKAPGELGTAIRSPEGVRAEEGRDEDWSGFCRFWRRWQGPPFQRRYADWKWEELEDFRLHLEQGLVWVAAEGPGRSRILGVVEAALPDGRVWGHEAGGRIIELVSLFVDRGVRRQGIGRRLVEAVVREARARGLDYVVTQAEAGNLAAIRFYVSLGFAIRGLAFVHPSELVHGETAIFLVYPVRVKEETC